MLLVFRIVSAIIIAYLILTTVNLKLSEYLQGKQIETHLINNQQVMLENRIEGLRSHIIRLVTPYYKKHNKLPEYIADVYCEPYHSCDVRFFDIILSEGTYYTKNVDYTVSMVAKIGTGKVDFDCRYSMASGQLSDELPSCHFDPLVTMPMRQRPSFDCANAVDSVEMLTCASDRLIGLDIELNTLYKKAITQGVYRAREDIKRIHGIFINQRKACYDMQCIDKLTTQRLAELKLNIKYGS